MMCERERNKELLRGMVKVKGREDGSDGGWEGKRKGEKEKG